MSCHGNQFSCGSGLVARVARSCHVWLSVSHDRMETLQVLQSPSVFTTDYEGTRVHVVFNQSNHFSTVWNLIKCLASHDLGILG